jgi:hypothetical protein
MTVTVRIDRDIPLDVLERIDDETAYTLNFNTVTDTSIAISLHSTNYTQLGKSICLLNDFLLEELPQMLPKYIVVDDVQIILTDYVYWTENEHSLTDFCNKYNAVQQGLLLTFPTPQTQTLFILTYSN